MNKSKDKQQKIEGFLLNQKYLKFNKINKLII